MCDTNLGPFWRCFRGSGSWSTVWKPEFRRSPPNGSLVGAILFLSYKWRSTLSSWAVYIANWRNEEIKTTAVTFCCTFTCTNIRWDFRSQRSYCIWDQLAHRQIETIQIHVPGNSSTWDVPFKNRITAALRWWSMHAWCFVRHPIIKRTTVSVFYVR